MAKINLTLVQTFYQLARLGSFSAAARELNLSYQSVANHVRRLEQVLKETLIISEQGAKQISLTPRGLALYNILHPELDMMLDRLTALLENQTSVLRIGMPQAIFLYLFPRILTRYRQQHPDIELTVYERDTALSDLVRSGSLDVFISERHLGEPVVAQRLLGSYRLSLVFPRHWGEPPAPDDIPEWAKNRPFISHEPGQTLRNLTLDFLSSNGIAAWPLISASSSVSVKRCVEEGLGFAVLPSWCILPSDVSLVSVELSTVPSVQVYFGMAGFLQTNTLVRDLFDVCSSELVGHVLDR